MLSRAEMQKEEIMWDAELYGKYGKERLQPTLDLLARVDTMTPRRILDVGCGSGMSTAPLFSRWQNAEIIGADKSEEMLSAARKALPEVTFVRFDCSKPLDGLGKFDLVFSNAFIQWIKNHEEFFKNAYSVLNKGGALAIQIPMFDDMPASRAVSDAEHIFPDNFLDIDDERYTLCTRREYYDIANAVFGNALMWQTDYYHRMDSHDNILEFLKGTALRPYAERLDAEQTQAFFDRVLKNLENAYPRESDGSLLFTFKRLFIVAYRR